MRIDLYIIDEATKGIKIYLIIEMVKIPPELQRQECLEE